MVEMKKKHFIEPTDFSLLELEEIFLLGDKIIEKPAEYLDVCKGKLLTTLFYEPSTRTRFSFEAAMLRLGGQVIGFSEPNASSVVKGESIADTIRTVACYADIAVMRHPKEGSSLIASQYSTIPVINAGDGGHHHPTQTLTDLFTIRNAKKRLNKLTIGMCGDLKFGRTVHSLVKAMSCYEKIHFVFISPNELSIPEYILREIEDKKNVTFEVNYQLEKCMPQLDILYMTRVQKERFFNEADYLRLKDSYILDNAKMLYAKKDLLILHPLPRVNEIAYEIDKDERAAYFIQAKMGMYVRMALIMKLLEVG